MKFTIWERTMLSLVVGRGTGTFEQIELGLMALKILRLSDEEKLEVGWHEPGPGRFDWVHDREYELGFDDAVWRLVRALAKNYQAWPTDERVRALRSKVTDDE